MDAPGFIDVSHWSGVIRWAQVRRAGVERAYIKATQATNFKDPQFKANWAGAQMVAVRRGAFHYFIGSVDGKAQAKYFADYVGSDQGELRPALDIEEGALGVSRQAFTERLYACFQETGLRFGIAPANYTSAGKWNTLTTQPSWINDFPLWLAAPDMASPPLPAGATAYWLHQYSWTGTVDGIDAPVDLNREAQPESEIPVQYLLTVRDTTTTGRILELMGSDAVELQAVVPVPIPSIPPPPSQPFPTQVTNQWVINLFAKAFGLDYIGKLTIATDEAKLFANRLIIYDGPSIEDMPGLSANDKTKLFDALALM
jgi:GH25 family lysozyme M1 (1,4-beta-N-acetylmuramidase)